MTTSRVVRGTKGRIFLYICAVLIITGIIACYNNTLTQLDEIRKAKDQCHQQQENLSTQLQVIFDYKQRLEKSLKTEKAEHQQTKNDLEKKILEEKAQNEKIVKDDDLKLSALQQNYKLLEAQHEDFKAECSKSKKEQLDQINDLQGKLQEVRSAFEALKNKYSQLLTEKQGLENQVRGTANDHIQSENEINRLTKENLQLQNEITEIRSKCDIMESMNLKKTATSDTNFSKQIELGNSVFEIPNREEKEANQNMGQMDAPGFKKDDETNNSFNALQAPNNNILNPPMKSSTKMSNLKYREVSQGSLNGIRPIEQPTVTPDSIIKPSSPGTNNKDGFLSNNVLPLPYANQKLPEGVVPIPQDVVEEPKVEKADGAEGANAKEALPNRYRNNIIEEEDGNDNKPIKDNKQAQVNDLSKNLVNVRDDMDNNALEVFDSVNNDNKVADDPLFGMDETQNEKGDKEGFHHIMKIKPDLGADYDKKVHEEENDEGEEDDDIEDYGNGVAHQKEPAVRH